MSSAQARALRQAEQRTARAVASKEEILDVLLAILEHHGGEVRIPQGAVHSATRTEVVLTFTADDLIIQTAARAGAPKPGVARRLIGGLFSGN